MDFHVVGGGPVLFDGARLPFADHVFDSCLLAFVLSYPEDPAALLREAGRVASGRVLVLQSSPRGRAGRIALLLRSWAQGWFAFRLCATLGLIPPARAPSPTTHAVAGAGRRTCRPSGAQAGAGYRRAGHAGPGQPRPVRPGHCRGAAGGALPRGSVVTRMKTPHPDPLPTARGRGGRKKTPHRGPLPAARGEEGLQVFRSGLRRVTFSWLFRLIIWSRTDRTSFAWPGSSGWDLRRCKTSRPGSPW